MNPIVKARSQFVKIRGHQVQFLRLNDIYDCANNPIDKSPRKFLRSKKGRALIKEYANSFFCDIKELVLETTNYEFFAYMPIAIAYNDFLDTHIIKNEITVRDKYAARFKGKTEYKLECGTIDILSKDAVIEVKSIIAWKQAIGQVLVYGSYFPEHKKIIVLFGNFHKSLSDIIQRACDKFQIQVIFENHADNYAPIPQKQNCKICLDLF